MNIKYSEKKKNYLRPLLFHFIVSASSLINVCFVKLLKTNELFLNDRYMRGS